MASQQLTIPSAEAKTTYNIDVTLPKESNFSREYLILLSFKEPLQDVPKLSQNQVFFLASKLQTEYGHGTKWYRSWGFNMKTANIIVGTLTTTLILVDACINQNRDHRSLQH